MLLLIKLYLMRAYLMLFVYVMPTFLQLMYENAFCFHALYSFIDTLYVYFKYYFESCTVLLICWFS